MDLYTVQGFTLPVFLKPLHANKVFNGFDFLDVSLNNYKTDMDGKNTVTDDARLNIFVFVLRVKCFRFYQNGGGNSTFMMNIERMGLVDCATSVDPDYPRCLFRIYTARHCDT